MRFEGVIGKLHPGMLESFRIDVIVWERSLGVVSQDPSLGFQFGKLRVGTCA